MVTIQVKVTKAAVAVVAVQEYELAVGLHCLDMRHAGMTSSTAQAVKVMGLLFTGTQKL
jgi:hypothetical protein